MTNSANLKLPFIMAGQAQKHITHNEAIRALDVIVQLSVIDRNITAPPANPTDGDSYIVAEQASGVWSGAEGKIANWQDDSVWVFYEPQEGWLAYVTNENRLFAWDGSAWLGADGNVNPVSLVGVGATADAANRLTVSSPNTLFTHEGSDHRVKINKAAENNTASLLYQNNWSGCAEIGLTGDNDFHFKVSPDGNIWHDAIQIDKDNGHTKLISAYSGEVVVGDNDVASIATPDTSGFFLIHAYHATLPQLVYGGMICYDVGTSLNIIIVANNGKLETMIGDVNGTTGNDQRVTVACLANELKIENRSGNTRIFRYSFLG